MAGHVTAPPLPWKEDATRHLLQLFLAADVAACPQADLRPFTPAVTEAITLALTSVDRRVREYAQLCVQHVQSSSQPDVQGTSRRLLESERAIQFYGEERLSVWKGQPQDPVDVAVPEMEGRQPCSSCLHFLTVVKELADVRLMVHYFLKNDYILQEVVH